MQEITFTKVALPYGWLGNMAPYRVEYQDHVWRTTEHLFQALRFSADDHVRAYIMRCQSPMGAKMEAKRWTNRWVVAPRTEADVENMRMVLKLKLEQHPELKHWLKETGRATLIEDVSARPNVSGLFWGAARMMPAVGETGGWTGQNTLGKLWMQLRDKL